jgi:hypothetical protein
MVFVSTTITPDQEPEFTALFPKMASAVEFAQRLAEPGNWAKDIVQKGRKVTFNSDIPAHVIERDGERETRRFYFLSELERVGYYGSTMNRKATLNGVKAPMSY